MKTIVQLKILFAPKDVSYNLTKSRQVSAASVGYSRQKAPPPSAEDRVKFTRITKALVQTDNFVSRDQMHKREQLQ